VPCRARLRTLRIEILKRLRTVIPIDVSFFTTVDPATLLFTGAVVDEISGACHSPVHRERVSARRCQQIRLLARSATPVGGLIQATQRELEQSPRYREILAPLALGDELRAALLTSGACWASCVCTVTGRSPFHARRGRFSSVD